MCRHGEGGGPQNVCSAAVGEIKYDLILRLHNKWMDPKQILPKHFASGHYCTAQAHGEKYYWKREGAHVRTAFYRMRNARKLLELSSVKFKRIKSNRNLHRSAEIITRHNFPSCRSSRKHRQQYANEMRPRTMTTTQRPREMSSASSSPPPT